MQQTRAEAILSAENSGKHLSGQGSAPDPAQSGLHGASNCRHICWSHTMKVFG